MSDILCPGQLDSYSFHTEAPLPPAKTYFAPAGRDTAAELLQKGAALERVPLLKNALDAMPNMVVIVNGNRQIVAANQAFLTILKANATEVIAKRPGEAVGCIRAQEGPDGCGTALHCATCGVVKAIIEGTRTNERVVRECRILVETPSGVAPLDLRVAATPFEIEHEVFAFVAIEDISHEKRVAVLQRTFFHDVLNTAGCIQGYADYLGSESSVDPEILKQLSSLSSQLIETIQFQRELVFAEAGQLQTQPIPLKTSQVVEELRNQYLKHPVAENRRIAIGQMWAGSVTTDKQLLQRVLGNMLKNALEATSQGQTVTLSCIDCGETLAFTVNNPEVMPQDVQLQVFQRSFSTKGQSGRGIGTYSMKLFGERYLGGAVNFKSQAPDGTTFRLALPKKPLSAQ